MCAGKLLSLLKKCLNRERQQQQQQQQQKAQNGCGTIGTMTPSMSSLQRSSAPPSHASSHRKKAHQHKANAATSSAGRRLPTSAEVMSCRPCLEMPYERLSNGGDGGGFCPSCRQPRYPAAGASSANNNLLHVDPVQHKHVVYVPPRGGGQQYQRVTTQLASTPSIAPEFSSMESQSEASQNFPPSIARSADGEEGYATSQQILHQHHRCDYRIDRELIGPPPNRVVHESDSPLPYRAHAYSLGYLDEPANRARAAAVAGRHRSSPTHTPRSSAAAHRHRHGGGGGGERHDISEEGGHLVSDTSGDTHIALPAVGEYGSPRTARILSAPGHLRTSACNNSHSSAHAPPPPYQLSPEYTPDSDSVFTSTVTAPSLHVS